MLFRRCQKKIAHALVVGAVFVLAACGPSAAWRSFLRHDQSYYAGLSADCDKLLGKQLVLNVPDAQKLAADTNALPVEVRNLHPQSIFVNTNGVQLQIGQGLESFSVTWAPSDDGASWRLCAYAEGNTRVVYVRANKN
jgi:hypothetical protein